MQPSICIIGGGLAGLMTSLNLRELMPNVPVVVVEKERPQSNTQISGMRFRVKKSGSTARTDGAYAVDIATLLAGQNKGILTSRMTEFGNLAAQEVLTWSTQLSGIDPKLSYQDAAWFGPQWGKTNASGEGGRGISILTLLRSQAEALGVVFISGEALKLYREGRQVTGIAIRNKEGDFVMESQEVILANGNAAGSLYESTNKAISHSSSELLFKVGFALEGATQNMWHPFGRCTASGETRNGCFETDNLAGAQVRLGDGSLDSETTDLLAEHHAHYHFKEICRRFIEHGSTSTLTMPDGEVISARVSLHYSHLGAVTVDGCAVKDAENVSVVGDAGGFLYWSEHQPRLPGFALTHCLVSARICADHMYQKLEGRSLVERELRLVPIEPIHETIEKTNGQLRQINTDSAQKLEFELGEGNETTALWKRVLSEQVGETGLLSLSKGLITSWEAKLRGEQEPISMEQAKETSPKELLLELNPLARRL